MPVLSVELVDAWGNVCPPGYLPAEVHVQIEPRWGA